MHHMQFWLFDVDLEKVGKANTHCPGCSSSLRHQQLESKRATAYEQATTGIHPCCTLLLLLQGKEGPFGSAYIMEIRDTVVQVGSFA